MRHLKITVFGKVQGVYFRLSTKAIADQLKVKGIIMNKPDGSVYLEAEGDNFSLDEILSWCHEGPDHAEVSKVEYVEGELVGYKNFEVVKSK